MTRVICNVCGEMYDSDGPESNRHIIRCPYCGRDIFEHDEMQTHIFNEHSSSQAKGSRLNRWGRRVIGGKTLERAKTSVREQPYYQRQMEEAQRKYPMAPGRRGLRKAWIGGRAVIAEETRQGYPGEMAYMEARMKRGGLGKVTGTFAKAGLASRVATGGGFKLRIKSKMFEVAGFLIAAVVASMFGLTFLGAGLVLLSFYMVLPSEHEIVEKARKPKEPTKAERTKEKLEEVELEKAKLELERMRRERNT